MAPAVVGAAVSITIIIAIVSSSLIARPSAVFAMPTNEIVAFAPSD